MHSRIGFIKLMKKIWVLLQSTSTYCSKALFSLFWVIWTVRFTLIVGNVRTCYIFKGEYLGWVHQSTCHPHCMCNTMTRSTPYCYTKMVSYDQFVIYWRLRYKQYLKLTYEQSSSPGARWSAWVMCSKVSSATKQVVYSFDRILRVLCETLILFSDKFYWSNVSNPRLWLKYWSVSTCDFLRYSNRTLFLWSSETVSILLILFLNWLNSLAKIRQLLAFAVCEVQVLKFRLRTST